MTNPSLEDTRHLIEFHFSDKFDKGGISLVEHMARVASNVIDQCVETQHTAWLHDIIEDTKLEISDLRELGYSEAVLTAVDLLTHRKKELTYAEYIDRICESGNRIAIYVKLADQEDNLDPIRWMQMNTFMQNALSKRYKGVRHKLMGAAIHV